MSTTTTERRRRVLAVLELDLFTVPSLSPLVVAVAVNGQMPTRATVQRIERELAKLPRLLIDEWKRAGGVMEVAPGKTIDIGDGTGQCAGGLCCGVKCRVAGDKKDPGQTALHEVGHAIDSLHQFSATQTWKDIYDLESSYLHAFPQSPFTDHHGSNAVELFAATFAAYFYSDFTAGLLDKRPKRFIESVLKMF